MSQRRMGKTGLIQYCFQQESIVDKYIHVYIDILSTTNLQEFVYLLGREVFDSVKGKSESIWRSFITTIRSLAGKISFDPITGLPSINIQLGDVMHPDYTLKEIFSYLNNAPQTVIVAIDEFQQVRNYPEQNVEALIRSHLLQINNCRMIFSGSEAHLLSDMFSNSSRPFYQSASFIELSQIPLDVYVSFIVEMFERRNKHISCELATKIYNMFEGITFYVQRVCNAVFSNTEVGKDVTEEILDYSIEGILSTYNNMFRMRLSQLTLRQKELLIAIAKSKIVEAINSVEFIKENALASASAVQTALISLTRQNLVVRTPQGYLIDDRFFALWIRQYY